MQLQFNKSSVKCLETVLQQVQHGEVTQELRLPEGMPDIGRVLTTWGQVVMRSKQWQGNAIQMTGGVMVWSLYAPEDGTEPRSVEGWIPFQLNWNTADTKREGPMRLMPLLTFADSRSISSRKLMLRAGVSAMVQALSPMDAEICTPTEIPEDVQLLKRTYPLMIPVEGGEKTFQIDEELVLPEMGAKPQKLLSLTVRPEITEKRVMSDKVVFKGLLTAYPVCRYSDGEIQMAELSVPFSQLSELDRAYGAEAQADIQVALTNLETDMDQSNAVRMKCGLVAQYRVDDCHVVELVQDAYSTVREVLFEESVLELPVILDDRTEYMQTEQAVPGWNGRIVDARFLPDYPRKRRNGTGTELEMTGLFQTLSYGEEGTLQGGTTRWEGDMHLPSDEDCDLMVTVRPVGKVQVLSSMEDMSLSSQLQLTIQSGKMERLPMIVSMELGGLGEPNPDRPSVVLTKMPGVPLWDLAKQNHSTVSGIQAANGIEDAVAPDRMLLIPVM